MAILRSAIEADIATYLNRSDLTTIISTWFTIAHKAIQRRKNWLAMEKTDNITLIAGTNSYALATPIPDFKSPKTLYLYNTSTSKSTQFYTKKDIAELRWRRWVSDPDLVAADILEAPDAYLYAIWEGKVEIWPTLDATAILNKELRFDYYAYLTVPATNASDFFTNNAQDYLMYRALMEYPAFAEGQEKRLLMWEKFANRAWVELVGDEVSNQLEGDDLVMRG